MGKIRVRWLKRGKGRERYVLVIMVMRNDDDIYVWYLFDFARRRCKSSFVRLGYQYINSRDEWTYA